MFGRFETDKKGTPLPLEWSEGLVKSLTEAYFAESERDNCFFDVYGRIFEKEFLLLVSYVDHEDQFKSPKSIIISSDIIEDEKLFKSALNDMIDLVAHILDDIFSVDDWNEYTSVWTENTFKNNTFHYRITRENIALTLQANELLDPKQNN